MRARNLKPGFFKNELLGSVDPLIGTLFQGLWCSADREGRLEDRPLRLCAEVFPYRRTVTEKKVNAWLNWLEANRFIVRYLVDGERYIQVLEFSKHQNPHSKEKPSEIPALRSISPGAKSGASTGSDTHPTPGEDGKRHDAAGLIPSSLIPDSGSLNPHSLIADSPGPRSGVGTRPTNGASNNPQEPGSGLPPADDDPPVDAVTVDPSGGSGTSPTVATPNAIQALPDDARDDFGPGPRAKPIGIAAFELRNRGVATTSLDPILQGWLTDGYSLDHLLEATAVARLRKPGEQIPSQYLDRIVRDPKRRAKAVPAVPKVSQKTDEEFHTDQVLKHIALGWDDDRIYAENDGWISREFIRTVREGEHAHQRTA